MVPDFEPSWSAQAVMSELDGWDSNVPNIDRSHHRHRSRTLVTEKPWTEWRTVLTVRRLITVKSAQKLGRHEVDSIHSQPPLHCPSDEAGDGLAVGGLYLRLCQPQPFPTSPPLQISTSRFCTNLSTPTFNFGHQSISSHPSPSMEEDPGPPGNPATSKRKTEN